jgi:hypothetical protein
VGLVHRTYRGGIAIAKAARLTLIQDPATVTIGLCLLNACISAIGSVNCGFPSLRNRCVPAAAATMLVQVGWLNAASTRSPPATTRYKPRRRHRHRRTGDRLADRIAQQPRTGRAFGSGHLVIGQRMADLPVGSASLDLRVASWLLGEDKPDVCQDASGVGRGQKVELREGSHRTPGSGGDGQCLVDGATCGSRCVAFAGDGLSYAGDSPPVKHKDHAIGGRQKSSYSASVSVLCLFAAGGLPGLPRHAVAGG